VIFTYIRVRCFKDIVPIETRPTCGLCGRRSQLKMRARESQASHSAWWNPIRVALIVKAMRNVRNRNLENGKRGASIANVKQSLCRTHGPRSEAAICPARAVCDGASNITYCMIRRSLCCNASWSTHRIAVLAAIGVKTREGEGEGGRESGRWTESARLERRSVAR